MKVVAVFLMLVVAASAKPRPCGLACGGFGGGFAQGTGGATIGGAQTSGLFGNAQSSNVNSHATGVVHGPGSSSTSGSGFINQQGTPFGSTQFGGTTGNSFQNSGFGHFG